MVVSESPISTLEPLNGAPKRQDSTSPGPVAGFASGLVGRVRSALGRRDYKQEVEGYRLALRDADDRQVRAIVDHLLELTETPAARDAFGLFACFFDRIEPDQREQVLPAKRGSWGPACAAAAASPDVEARVSAATLIGRICDPETFAPLRTLLDDRNDRVAQRAGEALMALAQRAMCSPALDTKTLAAVANLIGRCACNFERHRRREALGALLTLGSTPASMAGAGLELRSWLADGEHPVNMTMRAVLRQGTGLRSRETAWYWMRKPEYRSACLERLAVPCDADAHERTLANGHLLHNPTRQIALQAAGQTLRGRTDGLAIDLGAIEKLSPIAQAMAPHWIAHATGENPTDALDGFLSSPSDLARINALRFARQTRGADLALDFCFDPDPRIARSAALAVGTPACRVALGVDRVRVAMNALARSEHADARRTAIGLAAALDPLSDENAGLGTAMRMLHRDRAGLVRLLQDRVRVGDGRARVRAVLLVGRLGLGAELELELLSLISHSAQAAADAAVHGRSRNILHAAAAGVSVLADLPSAAAQHALHRCLRHPDDRVRANALDALARAARRAGSIGAGRSHIDGVMVEFKDDPHHRVRAAAARARLLTDVRTGETRRAASAIMPLLTDPRAMHRVSGLWLAERAAGSLGARRDSASGDSLASAVAEMVRADPEPEVKIRARLTASRLLSGMRAGWAARAANVG
jgi:HEAT repeat protein